MQNRQVNTNIMRDEWFTKLVPDEKWFFTYFLISPDVQTCGIANIPENMMVIDTGFELETIKQLKERMERVGKLLFHGNWVCIVNFAKHNPMTKSPKIISSAVRTINNLPDDVYKYFNTKLQELGADMSLDDYIEQKRRNEIRRDLRKNKPYLVGARLEVEIDRIMGIADSGKMDWKLHVENAQKPSDYPTPESLEREDYEQVAEEYKLRAYQLYWYFKHKLTKLRAAGREKSDYKALLEDIAARSSKKEFPTELKGTAAKMYAKEVVGEPISDTKLDILIHQGKL